MKDETIVPDTSVIIEGLLSNKIKKKEIKPTKIIVHEAVVSELEHQANLNKSVGFIGIEELQNIRELCTKEKIEFIFSGRKPSQLEIKHANLGEIDALIRELAFESDATLYTADKVQAHIAKAKGMNYTLIKVDQLTKKLKLEKYFDKETMSVHLRENVQAFAKKGKPGSWGLIPVGKKELTRDEIQDISREIIEEAGIRRDGFIEIERPGSTIVQLGKYRIVITKPPFSDGWEITAVRPVKKLTLKDYQLSEKLQDRIAKQAEGILIAGSPGMGKSTFAQGLAEYYAGQDKIVKTVEAPRDLTLPENVTQYAISHADAQEIHDILLLSRPDYTIFDEMRNTDDFRLFADLRLAGIGLAGVVHATNPIDAIQRFVGRIELGVIPQVIDTVIFIKDGAIGKVLSLQMLVKVPSGMTEADLARPVVTVCDFETKKLEYELYSYGEETVVVPVKEKDIASPSAVLASKSILDYFKNISNNVKVEMISEHKCKVCVPEKDIPIIIGKQGKNISKIEKDLGIGIDVVELKQEKSVGENTDFETQITKSAVNFILSSKMKNKDVEICLDGEYLLSAKVGKSGVIRVHKKNKIGRILVNAINAGEKVDIKI